MAPAPALTLVLALALTVTACCAAAGGRVDLWPIPMSVSRGAKTLYVAKNLKLSTAGSGYPDGKAILADAFQRMLAVVQMDHAINGTYGGLPVLASVRVAVNSLDDELKFGVDESYKLTVPTAGSPIYAQIKVGKALLDAQLLDVHFTRSFYKHILVAKVLTMILNQLILVSVEGMNVKSNA